MDFLADIETDSIDMIQVDPPYFGIVNNKWDNQWEDEKEYLNWCTNWTSQCVRVLKPNRMMIVWGTLKTDTFLKYKLQCLNGSGMSPQTEIIWHYNWGGRTNKNFARKSELAWCYSKGDTFLFNADEVRIERKMKKNIRTGKEYTQGTIPTNVWNLQNHTGSKDHCKWHPTVKNLDCIKRMILAYTNKGDTVLDCFSGAGTTMIACEQTGRNFVGCELDKEYYEKSLKRYGELTNDISINDTISVTGK